MWTRFYDMRSGGREKLPWKIIYIEAPEAEAIDIFGRLFDRDPTNVTCECCGRDYSTDESESLEQATAFDRGCSWDHEAVKWVESPRVPGGSLYAIRSIEEFAGLENIKIVRAEDAQAPLGG